MCWKSSFLLRRNQTEKDTNMKKRILVIMAAVVLLILAACGGTNFASTEWSIVFDQSSGEARYYHRENYEKAYSFWAGR